MKIAGKINKSGKFNLYNKKKNPNKILGQKF